MLMEAAIFQAKFIAGELDTDQGWDEYINKYKEAGYDIFVSPGQFSFQYSSI